MPRPLPFSLLFHFLAVIVTAATPAGRVLVEICEEGVPKNGGWPATAIRASDSFHEDAFGYFELPQKYVSTGVRDDRAARGIRHDGFEDPFLQIRVGVDAEVFGEINIRAAVARHQPPERKVRDLLHRRERKDRGGAVEQGLK